MPRLPRWIHRSAALLLPCAFAAHTAACAHSPASSLPRPNQEAATMTPPASGNDSHHPALTAEEIGKLFLKLIGGLKSRNDLSLQNIQSATGLKLAPAISGGFYGVEGYLGEGWKYVLNFYPESSSNLTGVQLYFVKTDERFGDMTPVCKLDFDFYHRTLKSMGFVDSPTYGEIGQLEDWRYAKFKENDGSVDFEISVIPQNANIGQADRLCVKSIATLNGR